jgi:hypothetical protein
VPIDAIAKAALLLSFDIAADVQPEHDDWHSHEHLPERLAIPGFLRGSRWKTLAGSPAYFVMYEVGELGVLASPAYMDRLNHPSPWTTKIMRSYRGMRRGLCEVAARAGHGLGGFGLLLRFDVDGHHQADLCDWLVTEIVPALPAQSGLCSAMLFRSGLQAASTVEQGIRGNDAGVSWALLVTGFSRSNVETLAGRVLLPSDLAARGAGDITWNNYQLEHCLDQGDLVRA